MVRSQPNCGRGLKLAAVVGQNRGARAWLDRYAVASANPAGSCLIACQSELGRVEGADALAGSTVDGGRGEG